MADDQNSPCLIADVVIDQKVPLILSYQIPDEFAHKPLLGKRCQVPLRKKLLHGLIINLKKEVLSRPLKTVLDVSNTLCLSPELIQLGLWMSRYYATPITKVLPFFFPKLIKKGSLHTHDTHGEFNPTYEQQIKLYLSTHHKRKKKLYELVTTSWDQLHLLSVLKKVMGQELYEHFLAQTWIETKKNSTPLDFESVRSIKKQLTQEQATVANSLKKALNEQRASIHLIYGVCGSGKTEVYFEAMEEALSLGLGVIYMVPEVSLAPQTMMRLKKRFPQKIALIHHQVSEGLKKQDFEDLQEGLITLVVGARSAIFAPIKNLGLIIIDEEHEKAYKQESMPTYHARDVAIMRARLEKAMVILGSATPSVETYFQAQTGKITLHKLLNRPNHSHLPEIHLAALGTDFQKAQGFNLFAELPLKELIDNFKRGEQSLIFINRRGYHALQQCSACAESIKCHHCSIPMTFHKQQGHLICHFCGYQQRPPTHCPLCGHETLQFKGVGTQLVEAKIQHLLKEARILRVDKDTTSKKGSLDNLFQIFSSQGADILIGTQMIAKGLDFSGLTLAIILNIDGCFNRPEFRAHEEAFQLMTQVAGRTGRSILKGQVFIQTLNPHHPLCLKAQNGDYQGFYSQEIQERQLYNFPPFYRMVRFVFCDTDQKKLEAYGHKFRNALCQTLPKSYTLEPLVPCFHEMIENNYRYHFIIKGPEALKLYQLIEQIDQYVKQPASLKRLIDVDPVSTYF